MSIRIDPVRRRAGAALLVAALFWGLAARAGAQGQDAPAVGAIEYVGLSSVDRALVDEAVRLRAGQPAYAFLITQSVRSLYGLGVFDQVEAMSDVDDSGRAVVSFRFAERAKVREVVYEGNHEFNVEDLKVHGGPQVGGVLRRSDLFRMARNIEGAYREKGYPHAQVTPQAGADPQGGEGLIVRVAIDEGQRLKIREILFTGNDSFDAGKLQGQIKTKSAGLLRSGRFQRDKLDEDAELLRAFYANHGHKDAQVTVGDPRFLPEDRGIAVDFQVVEGPRYYFGATAFEGATVFPEAFLRGALLFLPRQPYAAGKVDESLAGIYNMYTERGYLVDLRIDPATTVQGDTVAVTFRIREGEPSHVGDVRIVGNTRTKERVIRREVSLFPGDLLRRSRLARSQRDIFATGYFDDVQVDFEPAQAEGEVDVTFEVKDRSSATMNGGVGYSSQLGLTGFVKLGHNNLFGNGQALTLELERGKKREFYDISFTEPWVFGRPVSAGIDLYNTENFREVYAGEGANASYWSTSRGAGVRVGFPWFLPFPDYSRFAVGYSYSESRFRNYEALPPETIGQLLESEGSRSRVFFSLTRTSTDNPFHATVGTRTILRQEYNGGPLGGDMDYYNFTADHRQYFSPFWRPVLMLRERFGLLGRYHQGDILPSSERFRLGGITGFDLMRGYDDYFIVPEENIERRGRTEYRFPGGSTMLALTAELQFPVVDPVWGALFLDAGDTWNSTYDISLNGLKLGIGAGITMEIPMVGPIGFYYAYGTETRQWKTHFAFGPQL